MARRLEPFREYERRVVDAELDELVPALPALSLEGPGGVGNTSTARRRSGAVVCLDDPGVLEVITAQPDRLAIGTPSIVIDEWQRYPPSWDVVRSAVDENPIGDRFILTGSASPAAAPTHTGAGRVVTLRMRPLTLPERGVDTPVVSLAALLVGDRPDIEGATTVTLEDYTAEILASGFPGIRHSTARAQRAALDGYLDRIVDADLPELGAKVRDAATAGETTKPATTTTIPYRDALERLWILDPLPAWAPTTDHLARLTFAPEHHLADPALAARLTGVDAGALLRGEGPTTIPRDGTFLGALFESLVTLSVRVFVQAAEARVSHFRTKGAEREVDLISERGDRRILAVEVKLADAVGDGDVRHLVWLADGIGADLLDAMVVTTGRYAYRRPDGIAVVPLALLGA